MGRPGLTVEQERLADAFANLHAAYEQTKQVRLADLFQSRMEALAAALDAGVSCRTLADVSGLSCGRVHQLRTELESRTTHGP